MKNRRLAVLAAAAGLLAALPASASVPAPGVKGGGFIRADDKSKTLLTITASDNGLTGDTGQATVVRHKPGSKALAVSINLDCVSVVDSAAFASGMGTDGKAYLVAIQDDGEGEDSADQFGVTNFVGASATCLTGGLIEQGTMGTITGGNFQVFSG